VGNALRQSLGTNPFLQGGQSSWNPKRVAVLPARPIDIAAIFAHQVKHAQIRTKVRENAVEPVPGDCQKTLGTYQMQSKLIAQPGQERGQTSCAGSRLQNFMHTDSRSKELIFFRVRNAVWKGQDLISGQIQSALKRCSRIFARTCSDKPVV